MPEPLYVLVRFVLVFIEVLQIAMLIRAVLSWFVEGENRFTRFVYVITEPVIIPIRKLFYKLNWFQNSPIDMSFSFAIIAMILIEMFFTVML